MQNFKNTEILSPVGKTRGGQKLRHHKDTAETESVRFVPDEVVLPMSMHIGAPCTPVVAKGDRVLVGQLIADSESPEYISAKTYELLLYLSSELSRAPEDLRPALEWIAERPYDRISIPGLAARCGLSESTLRRRFTAEYGMSPIRYLTKRRLTLSRELLKGECSLKEIAARCGFPSPLLFTRAFKNCFGETPSACRRKLLMEVSGDAE